MPVFTCRLSGINTNMPQQCLWDPILGHIQVVCQYHLRGAEFTNPDYGWTGYLCVFYRYGDHDHYDEGYQLPYNAGRTANPVIAITKELFSSDDAMGRMSVSHVDSRTSLELIFLQGETIGKRYRVTVTAHILCF